MSYNILEERAFERCYTSRLGRKTFILRNLRKGKGHFSKIEKQIQEYIFWLVQERKSLSSRWSQLVRLMTTCSTKSILWEEEKKKGQWYISKRWRISCPSFHRVGTNGCRAKSLKDVTLAWAHCSLDPHAGSQIIFSTSRIPSTGPAKACSTLSHSPESKCLFFGDLNAGTDSYSLFCLYTHHICFPLLHHSSLCHKIRKWDRLVRDQIWSLDWLSSVYVELPRHTVVWHIDDDRKDRS